MEQFKPKEELNYENSVTEKMPELLEKIDSFETSLKEAFESLDSEQSDQANANNEFKFHNGTQELTLVKDPDNGKYKELTVFDSEFIPDPAGDIFIINEKSTYSFIENDDVIHLQSSVMDKRYTVGTETPKSRESIDNVDSLKRLEEIFSNLDLYISSENERLNHISTHEADFATKTRRRTLGSKVMGMINRDR